MQPLRLQSQVIKGTCTAIRSVKDQCDHLLLICKLLVNLLNIGLVHVVHLGCSPFVQGTHTKDGCVHMASYAADDLNDA